VASIGTDGIDGPTDAAGGIVDAGSAGRAATAGLDAARALDDNDCYPFLDATGDLVRLGPTGTNVGDLQVLLTGPA
jgi:hydroxypyruvate reductase